MAVFGPPKIGCSRLCKLAAEVAETPIRVIDGGLKSEDLDYAIIEAQRQGAAVVLLDGFPYQDTDIQWLFDSGHISAVTGGVCRLMRARSAYDRDFAASLHKIDRYINALSFRYFVVQIDEDENALGNLLLRCGVNR